MKKNRKIKNHSFASNTSQVGVQNKGEAIQKKNTNKQHPLA